MTRCGLLCIIGVLLWVLGGAVGEVGNLTRKKLHKASVAQCEVSAYAPSLRRCVATYWKEQTRRSQNCKYDNVWVASLDDLRVFSQPGSV